MRPNQLGCILIFVVAFEFLGLALYCNNALIATLSLCESVMCSGLFMYLSLDGELS